MWLQPCAFSIRTLQTGHFLVLAIIQCAVSDSFRHFSNHSCRLSHETGAWEVSLHWKQNRLPHLHETEVNEGTLLRTTNVHRGAGHHLVVLVSMIYDSRTLCSYRATNSLSKKRLNSWSVAYREHLCMGHLVFTHGRPSFTLSTRYPVQHPLQNLRERNVCDSQRNGLWVSRHIHNMAPCSIEEQGKIYKKRIQKKMRQTTTGPYRGRTLTGDDMLGYTCQKRSRRNRSKWHK